MSTATVSASVSATAATTISTDRPARKKRAAAKLTTAPSGTISYGQAWKTFLRQPNAWLLLPALVVTLGLRLYVADFTPWDLLIVATIIAYQPFQEWLIHVHILHWKPRKLGPFTLDFDLAKRHRFHHVDPWDTDAVFTPHGTLWFAFVVHLVFWPSVMPTIALALTTLSMSVAIASFYEFHHYIIHTTYKPKTKFFKNMTKLHRLHHFKNENYWYGVTLSHGDALLGTLPKHQRDVPTSPTARDLGGVAVGDCAV